MLNQREASNKTSVYPNIFYRIFPFLGRLIHVQLWKTLQNGRPRHCSTPFGKIATDTVKKAHFSPVSNDQNHGNLDRLVEFL